jgi:hypothetical protein
VDDFSVREEIKTDRESQTPVNRKPERIIKEYRIHSSPLS